MSTYDHCLYFNLAALNRRIGKIWEDEFAALGLAPSHAYVLAAIAGKPDISHKGLSELMEMDPSTITRFLDKLESRRLIAKSNKGKGATFRLTAKGEAASEKIAALMDRLFKKMQNHFGKPEFAALVASLHRARGSL